MNKFYLSEIYIYPIKSLGGISLKEAKLEAKGLQYDRRWMLIDEQNIMITQRSHPQLALLQVSITKDQLSINHKINSDQKITFNINQHTTTAIPVSVWDTPTSGLEVSTQVSNWLSQFMQIKVKLITMPISEKRLVDPRYASNNEIVSFADGYPCLLIGQSSLNGLNQKLETPILMDRFRPNLVFTGGEPHIEDSFSTFTVNNIPFEAVKPCARCVLITIDQQKGTKGKEPLKTLASYRTAGKKILFGQNLLHKTLGTIHVGDELIVETWK